MTMKVLIFGALMFLVLPAEGGVSECISGQYLHKTVLLGLKECRNCSECPKNEIIRKPCSAHEDTVCGPFKEFNTFHQQLVDNEYVDPESTHPDHHKHKGHHKGHHKHGSKAPKPTAELRIGPLDTTDSVTERDSSVLDLTSAVSSGEEQWKTLAMALIGILCVVSVSLVLFVMTVCYIKHKRQTMEKEIIYDPELMECAQSTYVQIQPYVQRPSTKTKSNIRALRELQQNAYDSGSDDSSNVPLPPSCRLLGQPVLGEVIVDDYDADHSGQTITTTKSSDYVYFNRPENPNA